MENILITGVSSGIGYATADYFLKKNFRVFGSVRNEKDAEKLQSEFGERFIPLLFDVTDEKAILKAKEQTESLLNGSLLSALVNNAGISVHGPMAHIPISEFQRQLDVNVLGLLRVTQAFLPLLGFAKEKTAKPGKIINISSAAGKISRPFMGSYAASKHAVEAISDALRGELMDYGIDVIVMEPGPVKSAIWQKAKKGKDSYQHTDYALIYKKMEDAIDGMEKIAVPAEKVAELIYKALRSSKAKTRYTIVSKPFMFWLAIHFFPDRMLDKMFYKRNKKLLAK